ncbi:MAG: 16S rRNA (cytosine(967)-C(5))-methyltransferase RsmB [Actinomycetota bacterium]
MPSAREIAYGITRRVNGEGAYLSLLLRYGMDPASVDARERALVTELAYGVQRHRGRMDFIIAAFSRRDLEDLDPAVLDMLRLGIYQLTETRVPQHAAVNETVSLTRRLLGRGAASYVNAVMRNACRGMEGLPWPSRDDLPAFLETRYSHPRWLVEYMLRLLGPQQAEALCDADNAIPPLSLRVNTPRGSADELLEEIVDRGGSAGLSACLGEALSDVKIPYGELLALLEAGRCVVQDESSMLVAYALDPHPGQLLIDACAAPGGKATHLAVLGGERCRVIAVDASESRLAALRNSVARLGLSNMDVRLGDSRRLAETVAEEADGVLVDAPCSGLGTLRRNPELKWRRGPGDLEELARLQSDLLRGAAARVRRGGSLVYSACTFTTQETTDVSGRFLGECGEFRLAGQLQLWPHLHHVDGMFIARFDRT